MKKILAALLITSATLAAAQTADELLNDGKNPENVLSFGQNPKLQMYSPLKQITKSNVKKLVPIWSTSTMSETGELAQPVVYNGVMYVVNGHWTFALDVATGKQIWRTPVEYDRAVLRISSSGAIYRGAPMLFNGKLFRTTLDANLLPYFPYARSAPARSGGHFSALPTPPSRTNAALPAGEGALRDLRR